MALFSRNFYDDDFAPVFRFIDAFDNWNNQGGQRDNRGQSLRVRAASFNPKFDVVEHKNSYELHGDLPGIDKKDVSIEFTEPQTLVIHGRVERKYTTGTPPAGFLEGGQAPAAIEEAGEPSSPHKATVTDEATEAAKEKGSANGDKQVAAAPAAAEKEKPKGKYWCQERSVGEFSRTFTFPAPVDEGAVKATMENGVLSVTIPKLEKRSNRRVEVS